MLFEKDAAKQETMVASRGRVFCFSLNYTVLYIIIFFISSATPKWVLLAIQNPNTLYPQVSLIIKKNNKKNLWEALLMQWWELLSSISVTCGLSLAVLCSTLRGFPKLLLFPPIAKSYFFIWFDLSWFITLPNS